MKIHENTFLCPCCQVLHKADADGAFTFETNGVVCCGLLDVETETIYFRSACSHIGKNEHYALENLPGAL